MLIGMAGAVVARPRRRPRLPRAARHRPGAHPRPRHGDPGLRPRGRRGALAGDPPRARPGGGRRPRTGRIRTRPRDVMSAAAVAALAEEEGLGEAAADLVARVGAGWRLRAGGRAAGPGTSKDRRQPGIAGRRRAGGRAAPAGSRWRSPRRSTRGRCRRSRTSAGAIGRGRGAAAGSRAAAHRRARRLRDRPRAGARVRPRGAAHPLARAAGPTLAATGWRVGRPSPTGPRGPVRACRRRRCGRSKLPATAPETHPTLRPDFHGSGGDADPLRAVGLSAAGRTVRRTPIRSSPGRSTSLLGEATSSADATRAATGPMMYEDDVSLADDDVRLAGPPRAAHRRHSAPPAVRRQHTAHRRAE